MDMEQVAARLAAILAHEALLSEREDEEYVSTTSRLDDLTQRIELLRQEIEGNRAVARRRYEYPMDTENWS